MALVQCPDCGRGVSTMAAACPNCGRPMSANEVVREINVMDLVAAGKRIACPDGNCTGTIKENGQCGTCGKPHDWADDAGVAEEEERDWPAAVAGTNRRVAAIGAFTQTSHAIVCPTCGSDRVVKISMGTKMKYVLAVGILAPAFKKVRSQFLCENCGYKW